jgi:polyphosphate kinase
MLDNPSNSPEGINKNFPSRYINRELSWLAFNARVLDEGFNAAHPLLERLNFLAISASNLDEFYMVRIGGLRAQIESGVQTLSDDGLTPQEQLEAVNRHTAEMMTRQQKCWQELRKELAAAGITVTRPSDLTKTDTTWLKDFFHRNILPLLTPIAVDPANPFPFIPNKGMALVLQMTQAASGEVIRHLIPLPAKVDRFIRLQSRAEDAEHLRYMQIERIIMMFAEELVPGFTTQTAGMFRVLRSSELAFDDRAEDLLVTFENALKKRRTGQVIRLSIHQDTPNPLREFLREHLHADARDVYILNGINGLADLKELVHCNRPDLRYKPYEPRQPERLKDFQGDIFASLRAKDIVIHHPYESFDVVVHFLRQAAADPKVLAIKQTLYRTSADSPIVQALIEAASAGKSVTAMIELKARFDEEANIRWARNLERAGAQVVYGFVDLKTHAKLSMVVRQEIEGLRTYMHFGTGNYHPINARIYTDLSYFTCDPGMAKDVTALFNYMTGYAEPKHMEKLVYAPLTMRQTLVRLIDEEIANAKQGKPAALWAKVNSLIDRDMIDKLYEASQAGVNISLIVRGMCSLRAGVPGLSERITVRSLIGRFLEHSRIVAFANGHDMPSSHAKVYITSGDWMPRNLDRRIELMVPVENKTVHQQVLGQIMVACLKDNLQSWEMTPTGDYRRIQRGENEIAFSAHDYFMKNPSLSGRGKALLESAAPPELKLDKKK